MISKIHKSKYERRAEIYKALANPIRLGILDLLKVDGETSVADMIEKLKLRKSNVSQHLSLLKYANLIASRRDGLTVYYKLIQPKIVDVNKAMEKIEK